MFIHLSALLSVKLQLGSPKMGRIRHLQADRGTAETEETSCVLSSNMYQSATPFLFYCVEKYSQFNFFNTIA